jgi:hypothetical protein
MYLLDTSYPPPDMPFTGELNRQSANGHVEWGGKEETSSEEQSTKKKKA